MGGESPSSNLPPGTRQLCCVETLQRGRQLPGVAVSLEKSGCGIVCACAELHIVYANVDGYASIAALRQPHFLHENLVRRKPGAVTMVTFLPAGLILTA